MVYICNYKKNAISLSEFLHKVFLDVLILLPFLDQRVAFPDQFPDVLIVDERKHFAQRTPFVDTDIAFCAFYLDEIRISGILDQKVGHVFVHLASEIFCVPQLCRP